MQLKITHNNIKHKKQQIVTSLVTWEQETVKIYTCVLLYYNFGIFIILGSASSTRTAQLSDINGISSIEHGLALCSEGNQWAQIKHWRFSLL